MELFPSIEQANPRLQDTLKHQDFLPHDGTSLAEIELRPPEMPGMTYLGGTKTKTERKQGGDQVIQSDLLSPWLEVTYPLKRVTFSPSQKGHFESSAGWAPTSYKWSYNPYKLPYKWVNGLITPISGVITSFITGRGPTLWEVCLCWRCVFTFNPAISSEPI